jgi:hypothetical protein
MPDIKHLYLPALAGSAAFQPPREAGHWHRSDGKLLLGISNAMEVSDAARERGVSSVPSAWARPLLFQSGLQNPAHLLHGQLLQEWRGLMSVLALREARDLGVDVVAVLVNDGNPLGRALRKLAPRSVQLEAGAAPYEWTEVLTIRYQGSRGPVALGALSPATLVYTATEYARALGPGDLPSLRDPAGLLCPPTGADDLRLVAAWLGHLHRALRLDPHPRPEDKATLNTLNGLINGWLKELGGGAPAAEPGDAEAAAVAEEPVEVVTPYPVRYRIYRELLRPLKRDPRENRAATTHSDLVLKATREHPRFRSVVVVTEKLLETGCRIWDRKRLHHLGGTARAVLEKTFAGASGQGIWRGTDLADEGAAWIRPEQYFLTDVLLGAEGGGAFLAEEEGEANLGSRFLLPFRREILDFFSPEDVRERLAPQWGMTPDGAVTFSFLLPIHGPEGSVRVEKSYRRAPVSGGRLHAVPVPVVELFPDYLHERWRRYYLFEGSTAEVKVTPVLRGQGPGAPAHPFREREGTLDAAGGAAGGRAKVRLTELSGDDAFPEALAFSKPVVEGEAEQWGLLLLSRPRAAPGFSGDGRVGIDLGTSNTNLKWRNLRAPEQIEDDESNTDPVEPWRLDFPRYLRSPMARGNAARDAVLETFFVPNRQIELPVPTSLRIFETAQQEHLLLDYFVSFTSGYRSPGNVYTNIKWSTEKEIDRFSEALLFLVLVDVVGREHPKKTIELACSYPRSFSPEEKQRMTQAWEACHAKLLSGANPVFRLEAGPLGQEVRFEPPRFAVEGEAAGRYFSSRHTLGNSSFLLRQAEKYPAVCLDVGGGTTDISVWRGGRIIFDSSIRLAGAQVSAMIQGNPRLQELLLRPDAVSALQECREADPFAARLNIALRKDEEHVYARLREHATRNEIRWIRQAIAFQFAGIAYYVAAVLGTAAGTPQGRDLFANLAENGVKLFWGGNASKLIRWIDYGETSPTGTSSELLNGVLYNALLDLGVEVEGDISQIPSPAHKSEAAGGLLVMKLEAEQQQRGADSPSAQPGYKMRIAPQGAPGAEAAVQARGSSSGVVSGERIELASGVVEPTQLLTDAILFSNGVNQFERSRLDMLSRFVEIFNGVGIDGRFITPDRAVELNRAHRSEVAAAVEEAFVKAQRTEQKRRVIEPVFVMELRERLRWMAAGDR